MGAMKRLLEESRGVDDCQDCGKEATRSEMGRRWCEPCWDHFEEDYCAFVDAGTKE